MNIYTRQTLMDPPHVEEALAAAVEVGQLVTKVTGLEIATWSTIFGMRLGSITWSARVDSQAALAAATAKLIGNADYEKWMNMNRHFFSGLPQDQFLKVLAFEGTPKPGAYNIVIRAQCAPGKIAAAMAWGVDTMIAPKLAIALFKLAQFAAAILIGFGLAGGGQVNRLAGGANRGGRHIKQGIGDAAAQCRCQQAHHHQSPHWLLQSATALW